MQNIIQKKMVISIFSHNIIKSYIFALKIYCRSLFSKKMIFSLSKKSKAIQFLTSIIVTLVISSICFLVSDVIGYRTVALILLFTVSLLAIVLSVYPVLVSALLSALIWDFFFIPPHYTFHVNEPDDVLMLCMYFTIALLNGILSSKIRQYEKLARKREERLNALNLYSALFNSISHELRTPITTIMGVTENLMNKDEKQNKTNENVLYNEIYIASIRLNRLVNNLLNLSRFESGLLLPKPDWCDVNELIHTVINNLESELEKHSVKVQIPEKFPLVKIDFGLIEQAINNIIHNASVHTPEKTEIIINVSYQNGILEIIISDNGPGFAKESIDDIYDKFYRTKPKKVGGLGLGLSISKGFISSHKGTLEIKNQEPHGAIFIIKIPVEITQLETENE